MTWSASSIRMKELVQSAEDLQYSDAVFSTASRTFVVKKSRVRKCLESARCLQLNLCKTLTFVRSAITGAVTQPRRQHMTPWSSSNTYTWSTDEVGIEDEEANEG